MIQVLIIDVIQWCTTFFGRGPQIDLLILRGPNRCNDLSQVKIYEGDVHSKKEHDIT